MYIPDGHIRPERANTARAGLVSARYCKKFGKKRKSSSVLRVAVVTRLSTQDPPSSFTEQLGVSCVVDLRGARVGLLRMT
jgi:hypothetical protein